MLKRIGIILFLTSNGLIIKNYHVNREVKFEEKVIFEDLSLNEKKKMIYETILKFEIEHPEIVFAQAVLESGNFNSPLFKSNNNLFGMKYPERRETTAKGKRNGYALYNDWEQSVLDYSLYQKSILKGKTISDDAYLNFLKRRYAEHPEYIYLIKRLVAKNKV